MTTLPAPSSTISKQEVIGQLDQFSLSEVTKTDIRQWLDTQSGDEVPRQELMEHLLGISEIEDFTAETYGEIATSLKETQEDLEKVDERLTVGEIQIQRDAMKKIQEYADIATNLVQDTPPTNA